jgi:ElaB/YqjD/DUF883 family membrane-anchored ribosome-binding protein
VRQRIPHVPSFHGSGYSATGDVKSQVQGAARQAEGAMLDVYGQAKDAATSATEAIGEKASEAEDFVRDTIERRPYTAAAVALAVGNLLLTLFGGAWIILGNPSVTGEGP